MRVNSTDLQNAFGKYLALVEKEEIVVVKNGKNVAKLIPYTEPDYIAVLEGSPTYKKRVTYEEYLELVNTSEQRYELINGEIYLLSSPGFRHQVIVNEIAGHFYNFFRGKSCRSLTAPLDVRLFGYAAKFEEDPNVVQPDIVVICDEEKVSADNKYLGVPTLVVEVLSSSTKSKDMIVKLNLYLKSGIKEYWIVDPEAGAIMRYSFTAEREIKELNYFKEGETIGSTVFEGLAIPLREIFT
ncbi:MAG TPA: type II toxin-antitoxin system prevent-host-death family antitoxin [Bacillota bacterium]|nr:type II toxin-antitoxin system prevent-host-death family antitoxin [Bacillota bacterium]